VTQVASTSASTPSALNVDQSVTDKDDFAAWDDDTQKQWKRFMKGSRSQEVCCCFGVVYQTSFVTVCT